MILMLSVKLCCLKDACIATLNKIIKAIDGIKNTSQNYAIGMSYWRQTGPPYDMSCINILM